MTQSILAQKQHTGPFLETREQELSIGTKINGIFCFIVGDISFLSFDGGYIFPTVVPCYCKCLTRKWQFVETNAWQKLFLPLRQLSWICCHAVRMIFVLIDSKSRLHGQASSWLLSVNLERKVLLAKVAPTIETLVMIMLPCCQDDLCPHRLQVQTSGTMVILTEKMSI